MSAVVLWLDHEEAKIYRLKPGQMETEHRKNKHHFHHTGREQDKTGGSEKFFHELATAVTGASEILVMGPGLAKQEFVNHLDKHNHSQIAKSIVGVESVDHPTEGQILDRARKFFKTYDAFSGT